MFTLLHPPAKLCYVLMVQHDVKWSARGQMSYVLAPYLSVVDTFLYNILWSASHHPTSGKNNKAVNGVVNLIERYLFTIKNVEVHPLFYIYIYIYNIYIYIYIYIYISIIILFDDKFASLTSVIFFNADNKSSSLN